MVQIGIGSGIICDLLANGKYENILQRKGSKRDVVPQTPTKRQVIIRQQDKGEQPRIREEHETIRQQNKKQLRIRQQGKEEYERIR